MTRNRLKWICLAAMAISAPLVFTLALSIGAVRVPVDEIAAILLGQANDSLKEAVIWNIRLPRVLLGLLTGAALAVSGAALQGLFRNPLADPGIIGIANGAALAAAATIVFGSLVFHLIPRNLIPLALPAGAFGGGLITTMLIYRLSWHEGRTVAATLLLAGIAISALTAAATGLFTYLATDEQMRTLVFWTLGSLGGASWTSCLLAAICVVPALFFLLKESRALNAMLLGEAEAGFLGFNPEQTKTRVVIASALAVGGSVAFCGVIGFVGLVVPHLVRLLAGADHRFLIPGSALLGASLLTAADIGARTLAAPAELPIGILTALIGAPLFLWLLLKQRAAFAG
ncbi:MAG TPA: iron ABC transporter permease [Chthoniobacterales bacterium]